MMKLVKINKCFKKTVAYESIISYRFFSTSTQIIKDIKQLESQLEKRKSAEGLVVLINGTSSCGKSTLSKHLSTKGCIPYSFDKTYRELWLKHIDSYSDIEVSTLSTSRPYLIEDMWKDYFGFKVNWNKYHKSDVKVQEVRNALKLAPLDTTELHDQTIYNRMYENASPILKTGKVITVDAVFNAEGLSYFEHSFFRGAQSFAYILRYEPILKNVKRVIERNTEAFEKENADFRNPFLVLDNFRDLYYVKSVKEVTVNELIIDELKTRDIQDALQMIKDYSNIFAAKLFNSESKQKAYLENTYSSISLFNEFVDQSGGLCVVAQSKFDFVVTLDLLGDNNVNN